MDYLGLFESKSNSLIYQLNMSNLTVRRASDELSLANQQKKINYLFQDDMIATMTKSLTSTLDKEETIETNNTDTGIEDFAPSKDFNKLLKAWTELNNLCSQYIELYQTYQNDLGNSSAATIDASVLKQRLKDKVVLALNG